MGAIRLTPLPLDWESNTPIWTPQWPLTKEKLAALTQLVNEQLQKNHIEPSFSPWNSPVFVIKKKSGKWRMLIDLRNVNNTMIPMGPLQPGLPSPSMVPKGWPVIIIDLQDCFFSIPLHPKDRKRFAFSVPSINCMAPVKRFQWKVLPQGMMNSPTICQYLISVLLQPSRDKYPTAFIIHYMDDILLSMESELCLQQLYDEVTTTLQNHGLRVVPDKIQLKTPFNYLGHVMEESKIKPQKTQISVHSLSTLNDFQKLIGDINWLRSSIGIPTYALQNLFKILEGPPDPNSPRQLTKKAKEELKFVEKHIQQSFSTRLDHTQLIYLYIFPTKHSPTAIIAQNNLIEWVYLHTKQSKKIISYIEKIGQLIVSGGNHIQTLTGFDPYAIRVPLNKKEIANCLTV